MHEQISLANKILDAVISVPDCRIEQPLLPELTSAQLFREVKRLNQTGHVLVVLDGRGTVRVKYAQERGRNSETAQGATTMTQAQVDYPPLTLLNSASY
jgi:hypothetical protein